jgi:hypothetical protein
VIRIVSRCAQRSTSGSGERASSKTIPAWHRNSRSVHDRGGAAIRRNAKVKTNASMPPDAARPSPVRPSGARNPPEASMISSTAPTAIRGE